MTAVLIFNARSAFVAGGTARVCASAKTILASATLLANATPRPIRSAWRRCSDRRQRLSVRARPASDQTAANRWLRFRRSSMMSALSIRARTPVPICPALRRWRAGMARELLTIFALVSAHFTPTRSRCEKYSADHKGWCLPTTQCDSNVTRCDTGQ